MSINKNLFRVIIISIVFSCLKFIVDILMILVNKKELIRMENYSGIMPEFSLYDYFLNTIILFVPLLLSTIAFIFFKDRISKIIYWIIAAIPIAIFTWLAIFVVIFMGTEYKYLVSALIPLYLIVAFYYNYRMINKELERKKNELL